MPHASSPKPPVTAILVTFNSAHAIAEALEALSAEPLIARIMVVDNASGDGTADIIRERFSHVTLLAQEENLGFGRANNLALSLAETPYALLINPDARLLPGALDALITAAERYPDAGIVAPQLFAESGAPQESYKRSVFARERRGGKFILPEGDLCAEFLSGACWLACTKALREIGGFDPGIFLYYEDDDLCLRLRRAGYGCVLTPDSRAVHLLGRSSKLDAAQERRRQFHLSGSRLYVERKYHGAAAARKLALKLCIIYAAKCAIGKRARYTGRLQGAWRFLCEKNA